MLKTRHLLLPSVVWLLCLFATTLPRAEDAGTPPVDPSLAELKALSIEELLDIPLVYGASRHSQKITEAPSSISIVTADEIKKFGYRTLADVLRAVQGFYVSSDRAYGYIGVRGFNRPGDFGGRVIVLVDGHRINDPVYDSAPVVDDFILDVDLIERVEVIRGPSFSLYGANAFFGGINVITRSGRDMNGAELAGRAGSFSSYQARGSYGKRFDNGVEFLLSASHFDRSGPEKLYFSEFNTPKLNINNGIAQNRDGSEGERLFGTLSYKDFKLRGGFVSRDKDVPTAPYSTAGTLFNAPGTKYLDDRYYLDLAYAHEFDNGFDVKGKIYYDWYSFTGDYALGSPATGPVTINRNPALAEWWGAEAQVSKRLFDKHRLLLGVEYKDVFNSKQSSFDTVTNAYFSDVSTSWNSKSWYLQDEYTVSSNVIFNAGLRYDYYSFFGDTINPRLALIYNPWKKTTLKLLYGEAFRAPNDFERAFESLGQKPNPDLRPETIRTAELIWDQYLNNYFRFSIAGYHNDVNDLIQQTKDILTDGRELLVYRNVNNASTWGADLEIEAKTESGIRGQFSYSWQTTEDRATGDTLTNSPEHLLKFNLIAPLYGDKLYAGFQAQYSDSVRTLSGNLADDYWLVNLNLFSQKIIPGMDFSAGVFNLFDEQYAFPGRSEHISDVIPQDGRTFQLILRQRF